MRTFFLISLIISSIGIVVSTLFMEPKAEGMGSLTGSSTNLFSRGAKGKEALLNKATVVFGIIFLVSAIAFAALSPKPAPAQNTPKAGESKGESSKENAKESSKENSKESSKESSGETKAEGETTKE